MSRGIVTFVARPSCRDEKNRHRIIDQTLNAGIILPQYISCKGRCRKLQDKFCDAFETVRTAPAEFEHVICKTYQEKRERQKKIIQTLPVTAYECACSITYDHRNGTE